MTQSSLANLIKIQMEETARFRKGNGVLTSIVSNSVMFPMTDDVKPIVEDIDHSLALAIQSSSPVAVRIQSEDKSTSDFTIKGYVQGSLYMRPVIVIANDQGLSCRIRGETARKIASVLDQMANWAGCHGNVNVSHMVLTQEQIPDLSYT